MEILTDPDQILALAYAKPDQRSGLSALFRLDAELGAVLVHNLDPNLAALRLAWWRQALGQGDAKASPLIADALAHFSDTVSLAQLPEGWMCLLEDMPLSAKVLNDYASLRGGALFRVGGMPEELCDLGRGRALMDFAARCSDADTAARAMEQAKAYLKKTKLKAVPKQSRALGVLAYLAHKDAENGPRRRSRKGSPRRALWALRFSLFKSFL